MMPQADEASTEPGPPASPLLPPRPNLGPEPWRSRTTPVVEWPVLIAVLVLMAVAVVILFRRRRRHRRSGIRPGSIADHGSTGVPGAIGDRRVSRAETLRIALIAAFGPSWGAKTTEEIAEEPDLASRIGPGHAAEVVSLLAEADRAKFSGEVIEGGPSSDEERLDLLLSGLIATLEASKRGAEAQERGVSVRSKRRSSPHSSESRRP